MSLLKFLCCIIIVYAYVAGIVWWDTDFRNAIRRVDVHVQFVAAVNGSEVRQEVEVTESADVRVDQKIIGYLLYVFQQPQLIHPHPGNVSVSIAVTEDKEINLQVEQTTNYSRNVSSWI